MGDKSSGRCVRGDLYLIQLDQNGEKKVSEILLKRGTLFLAFKTRTTCPGKKFTKF